MGRLVVEEHPLENSYYPSQNESWLLINELINQEYNNNL